MTIATDRIVLASRGSRLALAQTKSVAAALAGAVPGLDVEILEVKTTGDVDQRPFAEIGGKGLFTSEVERAVMEGRADLAVHSAKDLTAELSDGSAILCVPPRADASDVVVGGGPGVGEQRLAALSPGAKVGTSSLRRRALLAELRPDLEPVELRGNLDTRLAKVASGEVDVALLAAAGLARLGDVEVGFAPLDTGSWVPAPGQGALAIQGRADRDDLAGLLADLEDGPARAALELERAFAARMEGGCSIPLGCLARVSGSTVTATAFLGLPDGARSMRDRVSGPIAQAAQLGREVAEAIIEAGGDEILEELRASEAPTLEAP